MAVPDDLRALIPDTRQARGLPTSKYLPVDELFAELIGGNPNVYTAGVSKPGNVSVRVMQSSRAAQARYLVLIVEEGQTPGRVASTIEKVAAFVGPGRKQAAIVVAESEAADNSWNVVNVVESDGGPVTPLLAAHWPNVQRSDPAPRAIVGPGPGLAVPLTMDASTQRMARLAVATSPAVLFVGPPGTGKNVLLNQILGEIADDWESYGFDKAREAVIEPADEGWTTRDLVGGDTIDEARSSLRFRPGRVLDAIANDRWLVIDEANRADLDRIFGGLLTWLSLQEVVVGRASTAVGAPLVRLGWADQTSSYAVGTDRLDADDVGTEPIDYLAGTQFRLLGTYNALDAQRVFRFGLALGRRFAQVPVPAAGVGDFAAMLDTSTAELDNKEVRGRVTRSVVELYRAHHTSVAARLGPAMFLTIPEYVAKGIALSDMAGIDAGREEDIDQLVAEAYLLSTGAWLARLDEHTELPELAARLTTSTITDEGEQAPAFAAQTWGWVAGQLPTIGG